MLTPPRVNRTPQCIWYFKDNGITGICASTQGTGFDPDVLLPYGITDETRDLMLWAWECGWHRGKGVGVEEVRMGVRKCLGLYP